MSKIQDIIDEGGYAPDSSLHDLGEDVVAECIRVIDRNRSKVYGPVDSAPITIDQLIAIIKNHFGVK